MKIIHLNCHTIPSRDDYIFGSWPSRTAEYGQKYSKKYTHECWYAVNNIKNAETRRKGKIIYRLFPAWSLNSFLESFFGIVFSGSLIKALKEEVEKGKVIIHIQGERGLLVWQVIRIAGERPIFIQFHGYRGFFLTRPLEKIIERGEKYFFRFVNYFFVHFQARVDYLIKTCGISEKKIYFQNIGVDYRVFKPRNKTRCRKELNLPLNKNIILYVGVFNKTKGVQKIIEAHKKIKEKQKTFLIVIGGSKKDGYYNLCRKNADLVLGRIAHNLLPKYFAAADVYCMVCPPDKEKYGGLGIASIEALACGTPILNSNLNDAPAKIKDKIGFKVQSVGELAEKMTFIFTHKDRFKNLSALSRPFFSWETIVGNILKLYEEFE